MNNKILSKVMHYILFGEYEQKFYPKSDADIPRAKALEKAKDERYKQFWKGIGSPLLDRWQDKIRGSLADLLVLNEDCNCKTCNQLREIRAIVNMLAEAEIILNKE